MERKLSEQVTALPEGTPYQSLQGICHAKECLPIHDCPDNYWDVNNLPDHETLILGLGCPDSFLSVNKGEKQVSSEETHPEFFLKRFSLLPFPQGIPAFSCLHLQEKINKVV